MAWQWNDLGAPQNQTLSPSYIATASFKNNPMAFVWDTAGRLWINRWDGKAGHWEDHGAEPHGETLKSLNMATAVYVNPLTFTFGSNGHLWVNWKHGNVWQWQDQWQNQGAPRPQTRFPAIATASSNGNPMAFVWDSAGHLWVNFWDGRAWQWKDLGEPQGATLNPASAIATASLNNTPMAFVWDVDGRLWANLWDGKTKTGKWKDQRTPPVQTVRPGLDDDHPTAIITASCQSRPYVFVFGTDGHLWANWWDGQNWQWKDHSTPPGPDSLNVSEIAVASCQDTPRVFTKTQDRQQTDEHLWVNSWDGSEWNWTERETPSGTHFSLDTIAAIFCQSTPYVFVWDDDSDPHLWVNWRPPPQ